ncbi:hypothetical protein SUGI_0934120 [Cryptomeria japonica]|nr:hypothetical protein SUGI_0934120 [Cryptomeria japonica]
MADGSKDVAYKNATTMGYLSSSQALADFAVLITDLRNYLSVEDSPVVLFGGSYGGMLAAWFILIGALALSTPILAFDPIVNLVGYDIDAVSNNFSV